MGEKISKPILYEELRGRTALSVTGPQLSRCHCQTVPTVTMGWTLSAATQQSTPP